jgi:hypothetical protein
MRASAACVAAIGLAGCGDGGGDDDGAPQVPDGRMVVEAPIDDLSLITSAEIPTRYSIAITSGLPNGCAEFHDGRIVSNSGTVITVEITNTVPTDPNAVCTEIYGTHQSLLDLGAGYIPGTLYTVKVNSGQVQFTPD